MQDRSRWRWSAEPVAAMSAAKFLWQLQTTDVSQPHSQGARQCRVVGLRTQGIVARHDRRRRVSKLTAIPGRVQHYARLHCCQKRCGGRRAAAMMRRDQHIARQRGSAAPHQHFFGARFDIARHQNAMPACGNAQYAGAVVTAVCHCARRMKDRKLYPVPDPAFTAFAAGELRGCGAQSGPCTTRYMLYLY